MPNWIKTIVTINTEKTDIVSKIIDFIKSESRIVDFNKIIQMPSKVFRGDLGEEEEKVYGDNNWYKWSTNNWGTKWNAVESEIIDNKIIFETAWACPHPVLEKLSEIFTSPTFEYIWADEDTGYNCGRRSLKNGKCIIEYVPDGGSKEAYELAFEVNPYKADNYDFKKGKYVYR